MHVRRLTALGAAAATTVALTVAAGVTAGAAPSPRPAQPQTVSPGARMAAPRATPGLNGISDPTAGTLRQLGDRAGLKIGFALNTDVVGTDYTYRRLAQTQFSSVTPENAMKWEVTEPQQGRFDFRQADQVVAFAKANNQIVRGHTLIWHSQLPSWVTDGHLTAAQLRAAAMNHIRVEMGRYKGQINAWDVVNEAFNDDGTYRDDVWLRAFGPSYIADAFRYAHSIDPKATLYYNDYNIEGVNAKSNAVYAMVKELRAEGIPIQGVGLQAHLATQYGYPADILQNMQRFADLGVDVSVTEADVRVPIPFNTMDAQAQAAGYDALMSSCLLVSRCTNFTTWGISDAYSWIPGVFPTEGFADLWNADYSTKPAYDTLRRDLALAGRARS